MDKKSKYNDSEFILDTDLSPESDDKPLLENRNRQILFDFGKETGENRSDLKPDNQNVYSPLDSLKARMGVDGSGTDDDKTADSETSLEKADESAEQTPKEPSLLEKLKRYTTDETGHDAAKDELPLYKLESVAQIIKKDSGDLIDKLSQKYNVTVDNLGRKTNDDYLLKGFEEEPETPPEETRAPSFEKEKAGVKPTPAFEKMSNESKMRFEKSIFDELFPNENGETEPAHESVPDISDIDSPTPATREEKPQKITDTATIRFTPIMDKHGNTGRINISSSTKLIDIKQELTGTDDIEADVPEAPIEKNDFDLFLPKNEVTNIADAKNAAKKLAYKKRRNFLSLGLCSVCVFVLLLFLLPHLSNKIISSPKTVMAVCSAFYFLTVLANTDMFLDIANLFRKNAGHDCVISLCAALSIPLCLYSAINGENIYYMILLASLLMLARSAVNFMRTSTLLSNLRQITKRGEKQAVAFIGDNSTALAMAKNAIDGDVLIAAPRKSEFTADFMKFSLYKKKFSGKMPIIFIVTAVLSVICAAVGYSFYKTGFHALYAASAISLIAAMPALGFVDTLPLYFAARKLNRKGAMIAGTFGADSIELANAAVINTNEIFPTGSITLKSLKVLSENNIDRTIVSAAALTEEIGSPLAPIFNQIAGTNASYKKPDSDTIKYEEKLGLSGWVDNELLFIGNRTLMEAHGIEVPSIEVDKRILRSGYFPVYVAAGGNACALAVIQYEVRPDVQKLLKKVSNLGVTLLINNCDPNVSESMLCDYFGIYEDSLKVMTNVGVHMYKNATADTGVLSSPASFKGNKLNLLRIITCASNIRISNIILSVFYTLASIFGIWYFIFTSFTQHGGMVSGAALLLFEVLATVLAFISFLFKKP